MRTERHQAADQLTQIPAAASPLARSQAYQPAVSYHPVWHIDAPINRTWQKVKADMSKQPHEHCFVKARRGHDFVPMVAKFRAPAKSSAELSSSATYLHQTAGKPGEPLVRKFDRPTADRMTHASSVRFAEELFRIYSAMKA